MSMLIEMSIRGLMVDPITNMPIVILRDADNQRVLPIWVGPVEANAIALQIENVAPPRPMTHDLLRQVVTELGATLARVVITDLKDNTFYAYSRTAIVARSRCSSTRGRATHWRWRFAHAGRRSLSTSESARSSQIDRRLARQSGPGAPPAVAWKVWIRTISATRCSGLFLTGP